MNRIILALLPAFALAFTGKGILSSPNVVQAKQAAIVFYGVPETNIVAGGFIIVTAPAPLVAYTTGLVCTDMLNNIPCGVSSNGQAFNVTTTIILKAGSQFQFKIANAIDNPVSTQPTATWTMLTSSNESQTSAMPLTCITGTISPFNFTLSPSSTVVGQANTLSIKVRVQNRVPMGGFIFVDFPKWNADDPLVGSLKSYIQGTPVCTTTAVLSAALFCEFTNDRLTISGGATADIAAGSQIGFTVTGFKNPVSSQTFSGFLITTAIMSGTSYSNIDQGTTNLAVSDYASLSQAKLDVYTNNMLSSDQTAGIVQELDQMQLSFFLPVPLSKGCVVTVKLPSQYNVSTISNVTTEQVFGFYTQYTLNSTSATSNATSNANVPLPLLINQTDNSFKISACGDYRENDKIGIIRINQLQQPNFEKPTDSVRIYINTQTGNNIAQIESGVTFTPLRGTMQLTAIASNQTVQTVTNLTFTIQPQHSILRKSNPEIVVEFPSTISIASTQCIFYNVTMQGGANPSPSAPITTTCSREPNQAIRIKNFLQQDYIPSSTSSITFTFGQIMNPQSTYQVSGLTVTVYAFGLYAIDEFQGQIPWILQTGFVQKISVNPQTLIAYQPDNAYTFLFNMNHVIPQNGYVVVNFPPQVSIPDVSYSQSTCNQLSGFNADITITCQLTNATNSNGTVFYQLQILNAFRIQDSSIGIDYSFVIPGIQNPIQTIPTQPFTFATFTSDGYPIDTTSGSSITMSVPAMLKTVQLSLNSYTNSMPANYSFTLVPTVPIVQSNYIMFTFPSQIQIPALAKSLGCTFSQSVSIANITCTYDPKWPMNNTVRVQLGLLQTINALDRFTISFNNLINPISTQTTDNIQINVIDGTNYIPINVNQPGLTVTTNNAFTVSQASVTPANKQPGVGCTFTITFTPINPIFVNGGLLITYPPQITPDPTQLGVTVTVQVGGRSINPSLLYTSVDFSARSILVANIIQGQNLVPSSSVSITVVVTGLRNPFTNAQTDSFKIQSFNYVTGQFTYFIDKVQQGLFLSSKCSYPCADCNIATPDVCLSCYPLTTVGNGLPLLQLGKCVSQCATSRFYNLVTSQCDACDKTCLQCDGTSTRCTQCGVDNFLYFYQNKCLVDCPSGYLENSATNNCDVCQNNCLTCDNTVNTCTSCNQTASFPYIFHNNCLATCPPNISVLVGNACVECDSTCKTCAGTPKSCTSCESYMRFDPIKQICTQQCESETQIFLPDSGLCVQCAQNCSKCAGNTTHCTLCQEGYVLNTDFTCQQNCSALNQIAVNGICEECQAPCNTCTGQTDHCVTCMGDFKLYLSQQCVQYCPPKYELLPPLNSTCVYIGLVCPDGFQINQQGDGCVPIKFECQPGYEINDQKTACVPQPGTPVPFPFLLCAIFVSFLVLGSYLKEKFFTKVLTNLISLIGMFEVVMYGLIVGYAISMEQWAIMGCAIVGLVSLFVANIAFVVYYRKDIVAKDCVYEKWLHFFPKTQKFMPWVCLLINFKCSKMLYSGFFGLESSMAKFGKPVAFNRVMRIVTYFSFIFVYGPIFAADVLIFLNIQWGYQLLILGIETCILQALLIIFTWREFIVNPEELLGAGKTMYTQIKPQNTNLRVKSGMVDDSEEEDYHEGIPDIDEKTLIRSKEQYEEREINLRKMALNKILVQVGSNCNGVEIGAGLENCLTKFDKNQLKYRRAFSMDGKCEGIGMNNPWDDYSAENQSDDLADYMRERRYSWPLQNKQIDTVPNTQFEKQICDIKDAAEDYHIDNVYRDVKKEDPLVEKRKPKTVSRRTQTYLRELLQVEGEEQQESDMEIVMDEDAEIDETYAGNIIQVVIQNMSEDDERKVASVQGEDLHIKKQETTIQREIPEFELKDIMGTFEIDDLGNFIIIRSQIGGSDLLDNQGRKVNRRGYMIDRFGNVINDQGHVIFKAIELDIDDEIPAPFGFEKRKKTLINLNDGRELKIEPARQAPILADMSEDVENTGPQSVDKNRNERIVSEASLKPTIDVQINNQNVDEAENYIIDQITKQKVPKKPKVKQATGSQINNHPPKRIKAEDMEQRFPMLGIDNTEQKRLAKIASQISGVASQLAQQQSRYQGQVNDLIDDQERHEFYRQQQLQEIINSEQDDLSLYRMQNRPGSVGILKSDYNHSQGRPSTGIGMQQKGSVLRQNLVSTKVKNNDNLQRIYGNIDDLVGLEEKQINSLIIRKEEEEYRIRGNRGDMKMNTMENIYLSRIGQSANNTSRYNQANPRRASENKQGGRPTLLQHTDDPAELNVNTKMDGNSRQFVGGDLVDRVDLIQRNYINNTFNLSKQRGGLGSQPILNVQSDLSDGNPGHGASMQDYSQQVRGGHVSSSVAAKNGANIVNGNWM